MLNTKDDIEKIIHENGFLPFFSSSIPGYSVYEMTPPEMWTTNWDEGPWYWKGPIIIEGDCAYGKFYKGNTMYISMELFPDFMNWRRSRYKLSRQEKKVLNVLKGNHSLISRDLKRESGYKRASTKRESNPVLRLSEDQAKKMVKKSRPKMESFDTCINHLQMSAHVVTADFEYNYDKEGKPHGWGLARYCTPEDFFGEDRLFVDHTPKESAQRLFDILRTRLSFATEEQILSLIG